MSNTINGVVYSVADTLDKAYGYDIFTDEIKQDFVEPCFFIEVISTRKKRINNMVHKITVFLSVHYFPEDTPERAEKMLDMADSLYELLEIFEGSKRKYYGYDMNHRADSDILHFNFTVSYHLSKQEAMPYMEKLYHKEDLKHYGKLSK